MVTVVAALLTLFIVTFLTLKFGRLFESLQKDVSRLQEQGDKQGEKVGNILKDQAVLRSELDRDSKSLQKDVSRLQEQGDKQRERTEHIFREALLPMVRQAVEQAATKALAPRPAPPEAPKARSFVILAINDVYRIEGVDERTHGGLARVRSLRAALEQQYPDLLLLHAGDLLFPSLLSRLYNGEQMIDMLNLLDGQPQDFDPRMLVTFGNHEFDEDKRQDAAMLSRRIKQSQFRWLGSNVEFASGDDGRLLVEAENLVASVLVETGGVRVGVFSLTTDYKRPEYVAHFGNRETTARVMTAELRKRGAEVVVALTHLRMAQDAAILRNLGIDGPDLIIGGHEHNKQSWQVNGRWVIKADADARTAAVVYVTTTTSGPPQVRYEFRDLGPDIPDNPMVKTRVDGWLQRHGSEYCVQRLQFEAGCLEEKLGTTQEQLIGEELEIRRYETNLGNWIADQALHAFAGKVKADVAFINSGSLRLNQDIPAGTVLTRGHVEEIFAYKTPLKRIKINKEILQQVVSHAIEDWTGNGWWLQISGFAFRYDLSTEPPTARDLTLITPDGGRRAIKPGEEIYAVTTGFLLDREKGQDGYTMLNLDDPKQKPADEGDAVDLRDLVIQELKARGNPGIAPRVEGRICNPQKHDLCLAERPATQ